MRRRLKVVPRTKERRRAAQRRTDFISFVDRMVCLWNRFDSPAAEGKLQPMEPPSGFDVAAPAQAPVDPGACP